MYYKGNKLHLNYTEQILLPKGIAFYVHHSTIFHYLDHQKNYSIDKFSGHSS